MMAGVSASTVLQTTFGIPLSIHSYFAFRCFIKTCRGHEVSGINRGSAITQSGGGVALFGGDTDHASAIPLKENSITLGWVIAPTSVRAV